MSLSVEVVINLLGLLIALPPSLLVGWTVLQWWRRRQRATSTDHRTIPHPPNRHSMTSQVEPIMSTEMMDLETGLASPIGYGNMQNASHSITAYDNHHVNDIHEAYQMQDSTIIAQTSRLLHLRYFNSRNSIPRQ